MSSQGLGPTTARLKPWPLCRLWIHRQSAPITPVMCRDSSRSPQYPQPNGVMALLDVLYLLFWQDLTAEGFAALKSWSYSELTTISMRMFIARITWST